MSVVISISFPRLRRKNLVLKKNKMYIEYVLTKPLRTDQWTDQALLLVATKRLYARCFRPSVSLSVCRIPAYSEPLMHAVFTALYRDVRPYQKHFIASLGNMRVERIRGIVEVDECFGEKKINAVNQVWMSSLDWNGTFIAIPVGLVSLVLPLVLPLVDSCNRFHYALLMHAAAHISFPACSSHFLFAYAFRFPDLIPSCGYCLLLSWLR